MKSILKNMILSVGLSGLVVLFGGMNVFAAELKLNTDVLRKMRDESVKNYDGYGGNVMNVMNLPEGREVFDGLNDNSYTINQLREDFKKYGFEIVNDGGVDGFGISLNDSGFYLSIIIGECPDTPVDNLISEKLWDAADSVEIPQSWQYVVDPPEEELRQYYEKVYQAVDNILIPADAHIYLDFFYYVEDDYRDYYDDNFFDNELTPAFEAFIERIDYINNSTNLKNGWQFEDNAWRYYENGIRITGWKSIDNNWYYFNDDTSMMHSGFADLDGSTYHFGESGAMHTGWRFLPRRSDGVECWYYFDGNGTMVKGDWRDIDGKRYYFQPDGTLTHSKIENINGNNYYFKENGALAVNEEIMFSGVKYTADIYGILRGGSFDMLVEDFISGYAVNDHWKENVYKINGRDNSYQCMGFARLFFEKVYGHTYLEARNLHDRLDPVEKIDLEQVKVEKGDILRLGNDQHSIFITDVYTDQDGVTWWEAKREVEGTRENIIKECRYKVVNSHSIQSYSIENGQVIKYADYNGVDVLDRAPNEWRKMVGLPEVETIEQIKARTGY